jgi:hypothetical protein
MLTLLVKIITKELTTEFVKYFDINVVINRQPITGFEFSTDVISEFLLWHSPRGNIMAESLFLIRGHHIGSDDLHGIRTISAWIFTS